MTCLPSGPRSKQSTDRLSASTGRLSGPGRGRRDATVIGHGARSRGHDRPYRLLTVQGAVYCVGKVPAYRNLVTLAVDRIRTLELLDEAFTPDPAFDAKRYEAEAFGVIWERPMRVVLRFRADQAPYVREREWHPTQRFRTLRDGRLEMRFHAGGSFEIGRWIMMWGDAVEVVQPKRLRAQVSRLLRAAVRAYR